jgi:transcriptional regulator of arginine metabolism
VLRVDYASNIIVMKTIPGAAQGAAAAIDALNWPDVVGTIAGDDTIFVVVRNEQRAVEA